MNRVLKLAFAAISASTLAASSPAEAHYWHHAWAPRAYAYAPYTPYTYAYPYYDGAAAAGIMLGIAGAAAAAAVASQPYYHGCNLYGCW